MVSFQCDGCADTVKKPKLDQHRQRCWASFTCLDCSKTFQNQDYKNHTSCISEAEKYQGALYKAPTKGKGKRPQNGPASTNGTQGGHAENNAALPAENSSSASTPAAANIHPSRLGQFDSPARDEYPSRGGGPVRGRGARGGRGGRGGYQSGNRPGSSMVSGENRGTPQGGMRTWGSRATSPDSNLAKAEGSGQANASVAPPAKSGTNDNTSSEPKGKAKKPDKGDKGEAKEGSSKGKRKRNADDAAPVPSDEAPSPRVIKRLRKKAAKLEAKGAAMPLNRFMEKLQDGSKETMSLQQLLQHASVRTEGGKWVLDL